MRIVRIGGGGGRRRRRQRGEVVMGHAGGDYSRMKATKNCCPGFELRAARPLKANMLRQFVFLVRNWPDLLSPPTSPNPRTASACQFMNQKSTTNIFRINLVSMKPNQSLFFWWGETAFRGLMGFRLQYHQLPPGEKITVLPSCLSSVQFLNGAME